MPARETRERAVARARIAKARPHRGRIKDALYRSLILGCGLVLSGCTGGDNAPVRPDVTPHWESIGSPGVAYVTALTNHDGRLVVAGGWNGNEPTQFASIVTTDSCRSLGGGTAREADFGAFAALSHRGELVVGGMFERIGGSPGPGIARWNGTTWTPLGPGLSGIVYSLAEHQGDLIAAGALCGEATGHAVYRWDGDSWRTLGTTSRCVVRTLLSSPDGLVAGGEFDTVGTQVLNNIAILNGADWRPLGAGLSGPVYALTLHEDRIVAGGKFRSTGNRPVGRVAAWNGVTWEPIGGGLPGTVLALTVHHGKLIAGGEFWNLSQPRLFYVARLEGDVWLPMDTGFDGPVRALDVLDGVLYAGGNFDQAGTTPVDRVARWVE